MNASVSELWEMGRHPASLAAPSPLPSRSFPAGVALGLWLTAVFSLLSIGLHREQQKSGDPRGLGEKKLLVSRVEVDSAFLRTIYGGRFAPGMQLEGSAPHQK